PPPPFPSPALPPTAPSPACAGPTRWGAAAHARAPSSSRRWPGVGLDVVLPVRRPLPLLGLNEDVPCLPQCVVDEYQGGKRVGPPPTKDRVQNQPDQNSDSKQTADRGDTTPPKQPPRPRATTQT